MRDLREYRRDFPILQVQVNDKPLIYLDNAATSQKPLPVLETLDTYYRTYNANVHRGLHALSEHATSAYEAARRKIAAFINAPKPQEVIFTRNTTESINLVAQAWGRKFLTSDDVVLLTEMEHHSNIVPWQLLSMQIGFQIRYLTVRPDGTLDLSDLDRMLDGVKLLGLTHISNVVGTINPIAQIAAVAHRHGARVLVDGAQATLHIPVDVQALGCDFYAFSGHKTCGPTGIGVLWGKYDILEEMDPFLGGGEMIESVTLEKTTYAAPPNKFEAGTPAIAEAIALGAAIDYLTGIGMARIAEYDELLSSYAVERLGSVPGVRILGTAPQRSSAFAFTVEGIHPHDLSSLLDTHGIAVRAGHHCAQPLGRRLGVPASARASTAFYNVPEEIDALVDALQEVKKVFGYVSP
ncbi:MAG: cysteine desulfurase [Anaerolineae bacterium]|nr:cysteine desulfurase [Anaerolineae bacterium]